MREFQDFRNVVTIEALNKLVEEFSLAEEKLTKEQFVEALRQMIASGDFVRYLMATPNGMASQVVYVPFKEAERLRSEADRFRRALEKIRDNIGGEELTADEMLMVADNALKGHDWNEPCE